MNFENEEQFREEVRRAAAAAADAVIGLRSRFATLEGWKGYFEGEWAEAAEYLRTLGYDPNPHDLYHFGVVSGLFGDAARARAMVASWADDRERRLRTLRDHETRWKHLEFSERKLDTDLDATRRLSASAGDRAAFELVVLELIRECRAWNKLDMERAIRLE